MAILVLAAVPLNPRQPAKKIGRFHLDLELHVPIYEGRRYDTENPQDMQDLFEDQKLVSRSVIVPHARVRVMPAEFFTQAHQTKLASQIEAARVTDERIRERNRLAELAATAPATPPPADPRLAGFVESAGEPEPEEEPAAGEEEVPGYDEWSLPDLRAEAEKRGLEPEGDVRKKATWIEALIADDEADAADETDTEEESDD